MRIIALEEHFATPAFVDGPGRYLQPYPAIVEQLCELGDERIAQLDAAGIDVQVLSLTAPGVEQLDPDDATAIARNVNDHLSQATKRYPGRFEGFATLPTPAPDKAADELERAVTELGFKGGMINGHSQGRYLDDEFFWPILERAERLRVPLYLHPTFPPQAVIDAAYKGNYDQQTRFGLAMAGWGWHIDTATHVIRLVLSRAFDRFPELQLVIGHLGEGLSFMLPRLEQAMHVAKLDRPIGAYFRENVHYTNSGFNWVNPFLNLLHEVGAHRIMFATDHPFGSIPAARTFLDELPVSPADRVLIAHENAERLFSL
jgi:predicted TIM-barrel fold metal-dependent hydrolase